MTHSIRDIARALGVEAEGDLDLRVTGAAEPQAAGPDQLALAMDPRYGEGIGRGQARAAMLWPGADWRAMGLKAAIFAPRGRLAMAGLTRLMDPGPVIAPGHGDRVWLTEFLKAPNHDKFWGRTKLSTTDNAMKPVELSETDLADLVEMLYAESGAEGIDAAKRERGLQAFESACTDCHSREEGVSSSGPSLAGLGSREHYLSFISNPKSGLHMGADKSEMPRFDKDLSLADRDALAEFLVWLRTATQRDLDALGAL